VFGAHAALEGAVVASLAGAVRTLAACPRVGFIPLQRPITVSNNAITAADFL